MASVDTLTQDAANLNLSSHKIFSYQDDQNYAPDFKQQLHSMRQQGVLTDVTLRAGNSSVKCHKAALAAASPYFYQLFTSEESPNVVDLDEVVPEVLEVMVDFVYLAKVDVPAALVKDLSRACNAVQLASLKKGCDSFIADYVAPENAIGLWMFAERYHLESTTENAVKCLVGEPAEDLQSALGTQYQQLTEEALIRWISDDELRVLSEDVVFQIVEKWVGADASGNTEDQIGRVLAHVRLPHCTPEFLDKHVSESSLVQYSMGKQLLEEAVDFGKGQDLENDRTRLRNYYEKAKLPWKYALFGGISNGVIKGGGFIMADGNSKQWEEISILPQEIKNRSFHSRACVVEGGIVFTGGSKENDRSCATSHTWIWDTETGNGWDMLPDMSQARAGHAMVVIENEVYVFGGCGDYGTILNTVEKLDRAEWKWTQLEPMPEAVECAHAFLITGDIFVVSANAQITQKYSMSTEKWEVMAKVPSSNPTAAMIAVEDKIYVLGGDEQCKDMQYDTKTDTWTFIAQHAGIRCYCTAIKSDNNQIIVCRGALEGEYFYDCLTTSDVYDPRNDSWSPGTFTLPEPLVHHNLIKLI